MDNLPYKVKYDELPDKMILRFSGQLIINYIDNIRELVVSKVTHSKELDITIDQPESMDVTFVQLLLSLKRTIENKGKKVNISSDIKEEIITLIGNSGFNSVLNLSK